MRLSHSFTGITFPFTGLHTGSPVLQKELKIYVKRY